jgi:hypothetical protein
MKKYYYNGEEEAMGPYTRGQIFRFLEDGIITPEILVFREDDANWAPIGEHPDFQDAGTDPSEPEETDLPEPSAEEQMSTIEDQAKLDITKAEIPKLLQSIRGEMDVLWECQREAILARVMDDDLDEDLKKIRKESTKTYARVEKMVIDYWRKDGQLLNWIKSHINKHADYTFPISMDDTRSMRMQKIRSWLKTTNLAKLRGCYCWKKDDEYLYVGQSSDLESRVSSYEDKYFFKDATHIRILIPRFHNRRKKQHYKPRLNGLERLLLLQYQPIKNKDKNGHKGYNNADECLNYIMGEVKELATDAD